MAVATMGHGTPGIWPTTGRFMLSRSRRTARRSSLRFALEPPATHSGNTVSNHRDGSGWHRKPVHKRNAPNSVCQKPIDPLGTNRQGPKRPRAAIRRSPGLQRRRTACLPAGERPVTNLRLPEGSAASRTDEYGSKQAGFRVGPFFPPLCVDDLAVSGTPERDSRVSTAFLGRRTSGYGLRIHHQQSGAARGGLTRRRGTLHFASADFPAAPY